MNSTYAMNNGGWRRQSIYKRKRKEGHSEGGLYMWESFVGKGLLLTGVSKPSWTNYVHVCVMKLCKYQEIAN